MTDPRPGPGAGPNAAEPGSADALGRRQDPPEDPAPQPVRIARWLWIAATLVGLVRSFVQLSDRRSLTAELAAQMPQWSQEQVDSAADSTVWLTLMMSVVTLAIYVALANRMRLGRNWCRVLLAVIGVLEALGTLFVLLVIAVLGSAAVTRLAGTSLSGTDIAFSLLVAVIDVAATALMFLPDANRFFREAARRPRPPAAQVGGPAGRG